MERLVVGLPGEAFDDLAVEGERPAGDGGRDDGQEAVVIAAASAEPVPFTVVGQAGDQGPVELGELVGAERGLGRMRLRDSEAAGGELGAWVVDAVQDEPVRGAIDAG